MANCFKNVITKDELSTLASIVSIGDAAYRELMESENPILTHRYLNETKNRIRTKLVQIQCEIESHDVNFPFEFRQKEFSYGQCIPELRTEKLIIHIGRSNSPEILPYSSKYKVQLSRNNEPIRRQFVFNEEKKPPYDLEQFYGLLVFGGKKQTFSVIQFPEPGYNGIAESIVVPHVVNEGLEKNEVFERKKAGLKEEFLSKGIKEIMGGVSS